MRQIDLAEKIGISKQSLYKYIHNLCEPRSGIIALMAKVLNTTADFIVGLTDDPSPVQKDKIKETEAKREAVLLQKLRHLNPENQAKVEERIDILTEMQNKKK
jgi:transcriptional regulator with XRE-family HTH domain